MKRDLDLLRDILLRIEDAESDLENQAFYDLSDNPRTIGFHIRLLIDCEYLDSVRSTTIWEQAKQKLSSIGGSASLDVITSLCADLAKAQLGI